ncbi:MAG: hypothetical protein HKP61_21715 [Dactylosporangium sp.]|nr:hypothetical protein [Dactylosporangium sp.]NNJ63500.1 hypothetical protein [Dactylosporangium sp.]
MFWIRKASATLMVGWREATDHGERGDSPVPTAIIIAGLAILAAAVVVWAVARANAFMNTAPGGG